MRKYRTLAELEAAYATAKTSAHKGPLRERARALAAELDVAVPAWALPSVPALPAELARWLEAHPSARLTRLRGGVTLDFGQGVTRHYPSLAAAAAAVA